MDLSRFNDLRQAMQLAGITPKKGLGQHFLIDAEALEMIVRAGAIEPTDTVLEVGPGMGVMTRLLIERAGRVVAVEADSELAALLNRLEADNLEVVQGDILKYNLRQLPAGYKVVANIPYYLTGQLFRLFLTSANPPSLMVVLIQREVAQRITARPGDLSVLALSIQYYAKPIILGPVERHKFWPAPKVDSAVLKLTVGEPAFAADYGKLFRLIKAGFGEKRKQLKNSLSGGLNASIEVIETALKQARVAPTARAQELSLPQWERLYRAAEKRGLLD
jgi:16S rRNA (adenine1518-N6/adenine1519-N6)-dimethyltransferase